MTDSREGSTDPQHRSAQNTFTSLTLHRAPVRRRDETWIAERLKDPATRFVPVRGSEVLVMGESPPSPAWLGAAEACSHLRRAESVVLLGESDEHTYFAIGLSPDTASLPASLPTQGSFRSLRSVASLLDGGAASLLAYAKAMVYYHHCHRFCGACGAPTESLQGGHLRVCTDAECGLQDFPRTDPAIIVLVSAGERCLLGRQRLWPENLYSTIAGFVEPGESLEAAVIREVQEETGVQVADARYHSSQPWPFPRSLMIGFTATAESTAIYLHDGELADARWLSREEIRQGVEQETLELPSPISISHRLFETWFDAGATGSLEQLLRR